jgi:predicted aspartyl protease
MKRLRPSLRPTDLRIQYLAVLLLMVLPAPCWASTPGGALLERARHAAGGKTWDKINALSYGGADNSSGMQGRTDCIDDVKTGRMLRESDFQVVHYKEIWDSAQHWRQDMTGGVHRLDSEFAQEATVTDEWLTRRAYLKPGAENAVLGPVQRRIDAGKTYETIRVTPTHGQAVELWFDSVTGLLARTVRTMPTTIETAIYTDYRAVDGVLLPYKITTDDGPGELDVFDLSDYHVNTTISDETFQKPRTPEDTTVTGGEATVPIEVNGYVTLEARLNGQGPFAFILDTGGHAILTPEAARLLGLHPAGAGSSGGTGSGTLPIQFANVDRVEIGGVTLVSQTFLVIPLQYATVERGQRPALAGILGLELLERLAVRLDYRNQTLTFWPPESYKQPSSANAVPITFADDIPLLRAQLNGIPGDFALDTGNTGSLLVQHVWADHHGFGDEMKRGIPIVAFGAGGVSQSWASRLSDFELAGSSFHHIVAVYAEDKQGALSSRTEAGNIGDGILQNFALDFDYSHERIWFDRVPDFTPPPFSLSGLILFKNDSKTIVVANTMKNSPAANAGLRQGDRIVRIGNQNIEGLSMTEVMRLVQQPPGTRVPITWSREGHEFSASLVLKELLP